LVVSGGHKRIEQALTTQRELLEPRQKLAGCPIVWEDSDNIVRRPPLPGELASSRHVQRAGEPARIGDDMNEFRENRGAIAKKSPAETNRAIMARAAA
jgi:hypothetical protein